jgi:hypothetical protein
MSIEGERGQHDEETDDEENKHNAGKRFIIQLTICSCQQKVTEKNVMKVH